MKVFVLLLVIISLCMAAPRYGEDGGYSGYASYKALDGNSLMKRLGYLPQKNSDESSSDDYKSYDGQPQDSYEDGESKRIRNLDQDHSSPKSYQAIRYKPKYAYGYDDSNDVSADSPSHSYKQVARYGNNNGGYKMEDVYSKDYSGPYHSEQDYAHEPQPYEYGYKVRDKYGNEQFKKETSNGHGEVKGSYGFKDEYGLYRQVEYVADKSGFRANIKTNEPGTDNQDPADVHIDSEEAKY